MTKKTYSLIKKIPFGEILLLVTGNSEAKICSQMIADGLYEPIREYIVRHPDIVITEKLVTKILSK